MPPRPPLLMAMIPVDLLPFPGSDKDLEWGMCVLPDVRCRSAQLFCPTDRRLGTQD